VVDVPDAVRREEDPHLGLEPARRPPLDQGALQADRAVVERLTVVERVHGGDVDALVDLVEGTDLEALLVAEGVQEQPQLGQEAHGLQRPEVEVEVEVAEDEAGLGGEHPGGALRHPPLLEVDVEEAVDREALLVEILPLALDGGGRALGDAVLEGAEPPLDLAELPLQLLEPGRERGPGRGGLRGGGRQADPAAGPARQRCCARRALEEREQDEEREQARATHRRHLTRS